MKTGLSAEEFGDACRRIRDGFPTAEQVGQSLERAGRLMSVTVFNPWPQCEMKRTCRDGKFCVGHCSSITGVVYTGNDLGPCYEQPQGSGCPWDNWKPSKDIA